MYFPVGSTPKIRFGENTGSSYTIGGTFSAALIATRPTALLSFTEGKLIDVGGRL